MKSFRFRLQADRWNNAGARRFARRPRGTAIGQHCATIPQAWNPQMHSITSSVRASSEGGITMSSVLAVFIFTARKNRVVCSIGKSPGFAPMTDSRKYLKGRHITATELGDEARIERFAK